MQKSPSLISLTTIINIPPCQEIAITHEQDEQYVIDYTNVLRITQLRRKMAKRREEIKKKSLDELIQLQYNFFDNQHAFCEHTNNKEESIAESFVESSASTLVITDDADNTYYKSEKKPTKKINFRNIKKVHAL